MKVLNNYMIQLLKFLKPVTFQSCYGRPPLHGQIIQQVIQQVIQQIIQLFWSFWVGVTGLLYDFSRSKTDLYNIWTCTDVAAATDLLYEPHRASMSLIDKSVKWRRVTANHTAIIQLLTLSRFLRVIYFTCFRHFIISQTPDLVYRLVSTRVCFWIIIFDIFINYYTTYNILYFELVYYDYLPYICIVFQFVGVVKAEIPHKAVVGPLQ